MATGDDAIAAGMAVVLSTADRRLGYDEINKTRDYLAQRTPAVLPLTKGGLGVTSAAAARGVLDVPQTAGPNAATPDKAPVYNAAGRLVTNDPANAFEVSTKQYTDAAAAAAAAGAGTNRVAKSGDTMTGDLFLPNSTAASSGWSNAYINSDGRVCRGASSLRYKKFVRAWDPMELGDIFPSFNRFQMKADGNVPAEGKWRYGPIAEEMAANPDQERFVVYREIDGEVVPDSVDVNAMLLAQVAQLHVQLLDARADLDLAGERYAQLEARLSVLEDRA